jgi:hypothetical protein
LDVNNRDIQGIRKKSGYHIPNSEKSLETAEKVDILHSQRAGGQRIQLDHGAEEKPD